MTRTCDPAAALKYAGAAPACGESVYSEPEARSRKPEVRTGKRNPFEGGAPRQLQGPKAASSGRTPKRFAHHNDRVVDRETPGAA